MFQEVYEPLWVEIYHAAKKAGLQLRGIWIADAAHQGTSGILNEEKLGNDRTLFFLSISSRLCLTRFA